MEQKIDEIIQTIQEAIKLIVSGSEENSIQHYSYLFKDIQSGVSAINSLVLNKYGTTPDFSLEKLKEEVLNLSGSETIPKELVQWIDNVRRILQESNSASKAQKLQGSVSNPIDRDFTKFLGFIRSHSVQGLHENIKNNLYDFRKKQPKNYAATIDYYNKYKLWGLIRPEKGVYDLVDNRVYALLEHAEDFEWLYRHLCDNRSKKILCNILTYWATFDWSKIAQIVDHTFSQYFDLDLVTCSQDEIFVDIGAFIGDTLADYLNTFGHNCYNKFYCYDILPSNIEKINSLVRNHQLKDIDVRLKGVSDQSGTMFTTDTGVSSVSQLDKNGELEIPVVTIDDDIDGPVTYIKMDIEGAEESALKGCLKKIGQYHPKLSLSVYHNHKDMWKLARMIYDIDPSYQFYLRYYGGNLSPTEYLLYAF